MLLLLISLMASSVEVTTVELEPYLFDGIPVDSIWVAPGYELVTDLTIDPYEYGDPPTMGCGGLESFFIDTPNGEKWRIILTYDNEVVMLQEDQEPAIYCFERIIHTSRLSRCGRWMIAILYDETSYNPPPHDAVMINLDNGEVRSLTGIYSAYWIGSDGSFVTFDADSLRFYDNHQTHVGSQPNWTGNTYVGSRGASYATDALVLVEKVPLDGENRDSGSSIRAFDSRGDMIWHVPVAGVPTISANGEFVLVPHIGGGLSCLNGTTGQVIWTDHNITQSTMMCLITSSSGLGWASNISLQEGISSNPGTELRQMANGILSNDAGMAEGTVVNFLSTELSGFFPRALNSNSDVLWVGVRNRDLLDKYYIISNIHGDILFSMRIYYSDTEPAWLSSSPGNHREALDSLGRRFIFFDGQYIHVINIGDIQRLEVS